MSSRPKRGRHWHGERLPLRQGELSPKVTEGIEATATTKPLLDNPSVFACGESTSLYTREALFAATCQLTGMML